MMNDQVAAFCVYGADRKYWVGAIENAKLYRKLLPRWTPRFYVDFPAAPDGFVEQLTNAGGDVVPMDPARDWIANPMMWRFQVVWNPGVRWFLIRDTDSRLTEREAKLINQWKKSGKPFHTIHDHPLHFMPIMGGLWGGSADLLPNFRSQVKAWIDSQFRPGVVFTAYGNDQLFLRQNVLPVMNRAGVINFAGSNAGILHKVCWKNLVAIPGDPEDGSFIGEVIDANGKPVKAHRAMRRGDSVK